MKSLPLILMAVMLQPIAAFAYDPHELDRVLNAPLDKLHSEAAQSKAKSEPKASAQSKPVESKAAGGTSASAQDSAKANTGNAPKTGQGASEPPQKAAMPSGTDFSSLQNSLPNFKQVTPHILRGGQPTAEGIQALRQAGVKTIINLRNEEVLVRKEQQQARAAGINYINIPMDVFNSPSEKAISNFLRATDTTSNYPIYIHCLKGQDRTGTMIALRRILRDGWDANRAYDEMLALGFRPGFSRLSQVVFATGAKVGKAGTPPTGASIIFDIAKRIKGK